MAENAEIKQTLRAYLDHVAIPPGVLDQNNCLVVVNGRHNLLTTPAQAMSARFKHVLPRDVTPGLDAALVARRYAQQAGAGSRT